MRDSSLFDISMSKQKVFSFNELSSHMSTDDLSEIDYHQSKEPCKSTHIESDTIILDNILDSSAINFFRKKVLG